MKKSILLLIVLLSACSASRPAFHPRQGNGTVTIKKGRVVLIEKWGPGDIPGVAAVVIVKTAEDSKKIIDLLKAVYPELFGSLKTPRPNPDGTASFWIDVRTVQHQSGVQTLAEFKGDAGLKERYSKLLQDADAIVLRYETLKK